MNKTRIYGIDFFRIISMLMVVSLHVIGGCGVLNSSSSASYYIAWLLEVACYGAVNCYALISGYVGINSKYKYTNIVLLWLQIVVLNVTLQIVRCMLVPSVFTIGSSIICFTPICQRTYWYFTDYFILFLFIPLLNCAAKNLPKIVFRNMTIVLGIVFTFSCIVPLPGLASNPFNLQDGYSALWLIYLYLVGAYISLYNPFSDTKRRTLLSVYVLSTVFIAGSKFILDKASDNVRTYFPSTFLISYVSPLILVGSISLLLFFAKMIISSNKLIAGVKFVSPLCFGVYVVHLHPLIWEYIKNNIGFVNEYSVPVCIGFILLIIFGVFIVSMIIDMVRFYIFKWLGLKEKLILLEEKVFNNNREKGR